jgi:hypothetical protein
MNSLIGLLFLLHVAWLAFGFGALVVLNAIEFLEELRQCKRSC